MIIIKRRDFNYFRYCSTLPRCPVRVAGMRQCRGVPSREYDDVVAGSFWYFGTIFLLYLDGEDRGCEHTGKVSLSGAR